MIRIARSTSGLLMDAARVGPLSCLPLSRDRWVRSTTGSGEQSSAGTTIRSLFNSAS